MPLESLSLDRQQMKSLGYRVVDMLIEHFEDLPEKPIGQKASRKELENLLREPMPREGGDPEAILETVGNVVLHNILQVNHRVAQQRQLDRPAIGVFHAPHHPNRQPLAPGYRMFKRDPVVG